MSAQVAPQPQAADAHPAQVAGSNDGEKNRPGESAEAPEQWIHTMQAEIFFGAWIILNAVVIAIETDHGPTDDKIHAGWLVIEIIFNLVFLVEMIMRIVAERAKWPFSFWNLFDAVLVAIGIVDLILALAGSSADIRFLTLMRLFRLLRLMRVLRVLRLMRDVKELILLVSGIAGAFKAMIWGVILLGIIIFISALLVTRIVGKQCCFGDKVFSDIEHERENGPFEDLYGSMPKSMFTLFQFTMEFQGDYVRDYWADDWYGYFFTFFMIAYTLLTNLVVLNIIASIIVEVVMNISQSETEEKEAAEKEENLKEIKEKVDDLFKDLDINDNRNLEYKELLAKKNDHVQKVFKSAGLAPSEAKELFEILDKDSTGSISPKEFREGLLRLKQPPDPKDIMRVEGNLGLVETKVDQFIETQAKVLETLKRLDSGSTRVV